MDPISLLPASWQPIAHALAGIVTALSVLAMALKPALGSPSLNDPAWKTVLFWVLHVIDAGALNSRTIAAKREIAALKAQAEQ